VIILKPKSKPRLLDAAKLIAKRPLDEDDIAFLHRFLKSREDKVRLGQQFFIVSILIFALGLFLMARPSATIGVILAAFPTLITAGTSIACISFVKLYQGQARSVAADLRDGRVLQYQFLAEEMDPSLLWSSSQEQPKDDKYVVEILPISSKIHKVDSSFVWTWMTLSIEQ
jgi:hypothetical protein